MADYNNIQQSRLSVIMFTDMVGFSKITHLNPNLARELNEEHQLIVRKFLNQYGGTEKQTTGDGFFIEFTSPSKAFFCARDIQQYLNDRNLSEHHSKQIKIRIGLHLGEIFEKDSQVFGDTVNIAARLEPLSYVGGICFSDVFYQQIKNFIKHEEIETQTQVNLKNISSDFKIHQFVAAKKNSGLSSYLKSLKYFLKSLKQVHQPTILIYYFFSLASILTLCYQVYFANQQTTQAHIRVPNSINEHQSKVFLDKNWKFSLSSNPENYVDFNSETTWKYADQIKGHYTLINTFETQFDYINPSILLGLISNKYQVYLNNYLIGSVNSQNELGLFIFDSKILKKLPDKNILKVEVQSTESLNPGLNILSNSPAQLNEYSVIYPLQKKYYFNTFIVKNIYLSFSIFIFIFSFLYSLFFKERKEYLYSSLFLLFGIAHLMYYNPLVSESFEYPFLRSLRLISIITSSLLLISGYLASVEKKFLLGLNNLLILVSSASILYLFIIDKPNTSVDFVNIYNTFLLFGLIYSTCLPIIFVSSEILNKKNIFSRNNKEIFLFLLFCILNVFNFLSAFKNGTTQSIFSSSTRSLFNDIGVALPFLYAIIRTFYSVNDFLNEKNINLANTLSEKFLLSASSLLVKEEDSAEKIQTLINMLLIHFNAKNVGLYLDKSTHAEFYSSKEKNKIAFFLQQQDFVFLKNKTDINSMPLLINNVELDYRFQSFFQHNTQINYSSFICLPINFQKQKLGYLTIFDKTDSQNFTEDDLKTAIKVSSVLSLLILNLDSKINKIV